MYWGRLAVISGNGVSLSLVASASQPTVHQRDINNLARNVDIVSQGVSKMIVDINALSILQKQSLVRNSAPLLARMSDDLAVILDGKERLASGNHNNVESKVRQLDELAEKVGADYNALKTQRNTCLASFSNLSNWTEVKDQERSNIHKSDANKEGGVRFAPETKLEDGPSLKK